MRRLLKRCGAFLCVLVATLWAMSTVRWMGWDGGKREIYMGSGRTAVVYIGHYQGEGPGLFCRRHPTAPPIIWQFDLKNFPQDQEYLIAVPLWLVLLFLLVLTIGAWRLDRRIPPGHCQKCGYDLTGNVSRRCPECGTMTQRK
jgi:hypothetical protein